MKSLTYLVFYTSVILKVVILYVRLNLVLEALCNFRIIIQGQIISVLLGGFHSLSNSSEILCI